MSSCPPYFCSSEMPLLAGVDGFESKFEKSKEDVCGDDAGEDEGGVDIRSRCSALGGVAGGLRGLVDSAGESRKRDDEEG